MIDKIMDKVEADNYYQLFWVIFWIVSTVVGLTWWILAAFNVGMSL